MKDPNVAALVKQHTASALERATDFMSSYINEPDHVAVILATSKMDSLLEDAIRARLRPCPSKTDDLLESERGISTFSTRIDLANRLGIIDDSLARALHLFRKIRNEFAHAFEGQSLGNSPHKQRVTELSRDVSLRPEIHKVTSALKEQKPQLIDKLNFVIASAFAIAKLEVVVGITQRVDDSPARIATYP